MISTIRSYKMGRAYNNIALAYLADSEAAIGETLAFNRTIASPARLPFSRSSPIHPLLQAQSGTLRGDEELASVAVLRSFPSTT